MNLVNFVGKFIGIGLYRRDTRSYHVKIKLISVRRTDDITTVKVYG